MKRIFSLIAVLLLVVTLTGCGSKKENKVKENKDKEINIENKKDESKKVENEPVKKEIEGLTSIDLSGEEYDEYGTYDFDLNVNSSIVKFTHVVKEGEYFKGFDFMVNDKLAITFNGCGAASMVYALKDAIVISYHEGCDVSGNHIAAVNAKGELLFDYEYLDEDYPGMHVSLGKPTIENDKIIVSGTSATHGPSLVLDSDYHAAYMCDSEEFSKANISDDYVAAGTYEITYANGKFSKPVLKEKTTVKEYIEKNCNY